MPVEPFHFFSHHNLTYLLGRKARNLGELLTGIRGVPGSSIYHHTHHFLEQHEFLSPEPPNDFAYWITQILQLEVLGERVASIDLREYQRIRDIREQTIKVIEEYVNKNPDTADRNAPPGEEFHFMKSQTFVFPTRHFARDLVEFKECLKNVSTYSIYYHTFGSRLRLSEHQNDFSIWLEKLGEPKLASAFLRLDPYTQTLDNLRNSLIRLVEARFMAEKTHADP